MALYQGMTILARVLMWLLWIFTVVVMIFLAYDSPPMPRHLGKSAVLFYSFVAFFMSVMCGSFWLLIAFVRQPWLNLPIYAVGLMAILTTTVIGGTELIGAYYFFHTLGATLLMAYIPPLIPK